MQGCFLWFYTSDEASRLVGGEGKIEYKEFYNDAVNSVVDIKQDYRRWYDSKINGYVLSKPF